SFAFILGVVPLMRGEGAGAEMRRSLGTAVVSGMIGVTVFGVLLTPVFYYVLMWFGERPGGAKAAAPRPAGEVAEHVPVVEPPGDGVGKLPPEAEAGIRTEPGVPGQ